MGARLPARSGPRTVPALVALVVALPAAADAQGVRGWVGTSVQMVDLRPIGLDTVPISALEIAEDGSRTYQGQAVTCVGDVVCTTYGTRAKDRTVAATQDVSLTAWGLGVQGLSVTTMLRGRARSGGDLVWPRSDDAFDLILGYAQWIRGPARVRLGRQEIRSGLGFPAFDGAWASYGQGRLTLEAYGGRSIARGLREPTNDALRSLESFIPDESVLLFGGAAHARLDRASVSARYQRELLSDRSGIVSERASLDVLSSLPGVRLSGSLDYDFAFERFGKGHLTVGVPLAGGRWVVEASGRRYVPYFELNTIWGFFEPVSYSEAELRASWSPTSELGLWVSGGWRTYAESGATVVFRELRDDGWRANTGLRWKVSPRATLDGSYRLEWGPGAFLSSGDAALRFEASDRVDLSVHGMTFQQIEEFRIGDGRAFGAGVSFDARVTERATLSGGGSLLRHRDGGTVTSSPWNQSRAWSALRIDVGNDPGLSRRRSR